MDKATKEALAKADATLMPTQPKSSTIFYGKGKSADSITLMLRKEYLEATNTLLKKTFEGTVTYETV